MSNHRGKLDDRVVVLDLGREWIEVKTEAVFDKTACNFRPVDPGECRDVGVVVADGTVNFAIDR